MKFIITTLLLMILISSKGIAQYDCRSFEDCFNVGVAVYQEENYEGAVGYLTNAIKNWKDSDGTTKLISAHMYRGNSSPGRDKFADTIKDYY